MRAAPFPSEDETNQKEDEVVSDPLSDAFLTLWDNTARGNRQVYNEIFKTVPSDIVRNWNQYKVTSRSCRIKKLITDPLLR